MNDPKMAWSEVAESMSALGLKLKLHFEQAGADPGAPAELQDALRQLAAAIEGGFAGVANAVRDRAVHDDVTRVAQSIADALSSSLTDAGHDLAAAVKSRAGALHLK